MGINLTVAQEPQCAALFGGTLGPEGTCCYDQPDNATCLEQGLPTCWMCDWDRTWPTPFIVNCCYDHYGYKYVADTSREQCSSCLGTEVGRIEECQETSEPTRPCCVLDAIEPRHSYCINLPPDRIDECERPLGQLGWAGKLGPVGTCCAMGGIDGVVCGGGFARCWICENVFGATDTRSTCCFDDLPGDPQWFPYGLYNGHRQLPGILS